MNRNKLFAGVIGLLFFATGLSAKDYQAVMFGIKSDGVTLNTRSIQRAVDYISEQGGGRLIFYVGRYLTGSVELKSNVTIRVTEGAVLVAAPSVYDLKGTDGCNALFYAVKQKNIGIGGKGIIDGCNVAVRASIEMVGCENVKIEQITLQDAGNTAEVYKDCRNVAVDEVVVHGGTSRRKAVSLSGCDGVAMTDCYFDMEAEPLQTDGTSRRLSFVNCVTLDGKNVSCEK